MKIRVMLMRRDDLDDNEKKALQELYPGHEFDPFRTDPMDFRDHLRICEESKPDVVILPREKPVPVLAMEKGFVHVTMTPKGFMRLLRVVPDFVEFKPGEQVPELAGDLYRHNVLCGVVHELEHSGRGKEHELNVLRQMCDELRRQLY